MLYVISWYNINMNDGFDTVLWDIKEEDRGSLPKEFIIKRSLVYGGIFLIRDIYNRYGEGEVKKVFNTLKPSEVGAKRYNFFKNYLFI